MITSTKQSWAAKNVFKTHVASNEISITCLSERDTKELSNFGTWRKHKLIQDLRKKNMKRLHDSTIKKEIVHKKGSNGDLKEKDPDEQKWPKKRHNVWGKNSVNEKTLWKVCVSLNLKWKKHTHLVCVFMEFSSRTKPQMK